MSTETTYQWLEPKPYKRFTRQLGIKGRNMIVWNLVHPIVVQGHSPEEIARRFDLPLEAVREAVDYYYANEGWINEEVESMARKHRDEIRFRADVLTLFYRSAKLERRLAFPMTPRDIGCRKP